MNKVNIVSSPEEELMDDGFIYVDEDVNDSESSHIQKKKQETMKNTNEDIIETDQILIRNSNESQI